MTDDVDPSRWGGDGELIEHAIDRLHTGSHRWPLTGSVAVGLLALIVNLKTLQESRNCPAPVRQLMTVIGATAGITLLARCLASGPGRTWSVLRFCAVDRWRREGTPAPNS